MNDLVKVMIKPRFKFWKQWVYISETGGTTYDRAESATFTPEQAMRFQDYYLFSIRVRVKIVSFYH